MDAERQTERTARAVDLAEHNVLAAFPDMEAARKAIDGLERAGVDASNVSLLGPAAEEAAEQTDTTQRDVDTTGFVAKRAVAAGAAGSVAGGTVGFLAGLAAFSIPGVGPVIGAGIWASTIGGAVAGGAVGGMIGGVSSLDVTPAWELTHEAVREGRVVVGVHSDRAEDVATGAEVLHGLDPVTVGRFDRRGNRLESS